MSLFDENKKLIVAQGTLAQWFTIGQRDKKSKLTSDADGLHLDKNFYLDRELIVTGVTRLTELRTSRSAYLHDIDVAGRFIVDELGKAYIEEAEIEHLVSKTHSVLESANINNLESETFKVNGESTFVGDLSALGTSTLARLIVTGKSTLDELFVTKGVDVNTLNVRSKATLAELEVTGPSKFTGLINSQNVKIAQTLEVADSFRIDSNSNVSTKGSIDTTLIQVVKYNDGVKEVGSEITPDRITTPTLRVLRDDVVLGDEAIVLDNSGARVERATRFDEDVTLSKDISIAGSAQISSDLNVSGASTFNTITATGKSTLADTFISKLESTGFKNTGSFEVISNDASITGALTIKKDSTHTGDLTVQGDLNVLGKSIVSDVHRLQVEDAIIVTNKNGNAIPDYTGIAMLTGAAQTAAGYPAHAAPLYDPSTQTLKIGLGTYKDGVFTPTAGEMQSIATRADTIVNDRLLKWDSANYTIVDSGMNLNDLVFRSPEAGKKFAYGWDNDHLHHWYVSESADAITLALRDAGGRIYTNNPTERLHSTNKGYVDDVDATKITFQPNDTNFDKVYLQARGVTNNVQQMVTVSPYLLSDGTSWSLVQRDTNGRARINEPLLGKEISNKNYTDSVVVIEKVDTTLVGNRWIYESFNLGRVPVVVYDASGDELIVSKQLTNSGFLLSADEEFHGYVVCWTDPGQTNPFRQAINSYEYKLDGDTLYIY